MSKPPRTIGLWRQEFVASFAVPPEIENHPALIDISWHSEMCPSFTSIDQYNIGDMPALRLWVDHPDAETRELPDTKRFLVHHQNPDNGATIHEFETDDVNEAIAKFVELAQIVTRTIKRV